MSRCPPRRRGRRACQPRLPSLACPRTPRSSSLTRLPSWTSSKRSWTNMMWSLRVTGYLCTPICWRAVVWSASTSAVPGRSLTSRRPMNSNMPRGIWSGKRFCTAPRASGRRPGWPATAGRLARSPLSLNWAVGAGGKLRPSSRGPVPRVYGCSTAHWSAHRGGQSRRGRLSRPYSPPRHDYPPWRIHTDAPRP